jgi:hypothetical protein
MATGLVTEFLRAKMKDPEASAALYAVSSEVDGSRVSQAMAVKANAAVIEMLRTAREPLAADPQLVAAMLQGAMAGVIRRLLEGTSPEGQFEKLREELVFLCCAYLKACSARVR